MSLYMLQSFKQWLPHDKALFGEVLANVRSWDIREKRRNQLGILWSIIQIHQHKPALAFSLLHFFSLDTQQPLIREQSQTQISKNTHMPR